MGGCHWNGGFRKSNRSWDRNIIFIRNTVIFSDRKVWYAGKPQYYMSSCGSCGHFMHASWSDNIHLGWFDIGDLEFTICLVLHWRNVIVCITKGPKTLNTFQFLLIKNKCNMLMQNLLFVAGYRKYRIHRNPIKWTRNNTTNNHQRHNLRLYVFYTAI